MSERKLYLVEGGRPQSRVYPTFLYGRFHIDFVWAFGPEAERERLIVLANGTGPDAYTRIASSSHERLRAMEDYARAWFNAEKGQVVYFEYTEDANFRSISDKFAFGLDNRNAYPGYVNCTLRLVIVFLFNGQLIGMYPYRRRMDERGRWKEEDQGAMNAGTSVENTSRFHPIDYWELSPKIILKLEKAIALWKSEQRPTWALPWTIEQYEQQEERRETWRKEERRNVRARLSKDVEEVWTYGKQDIKEELAALANIKSGTLPSLALLKQASADAKEAMHLRAKTWWKDAHPSRLYFWVGEDNEIHPFSSSLQSDFASGLRPLLFLARKTIHVLDVYCVAQRLVEYRPFQMTFDRTAQWKKEERELYTKQNYTDGRYRVEFDTECGTFEPRLNWRPNEDVVAHLRTLLVGWTEKDERRIRCSRRESQFKALIAAKARRKAK